MAMGMDLGLSAGGRSNPQSRNNGDFKRLLTHDNPIFLVLDNVTINGRNVRLLNPDGALRFLLERTDRRIVSRDDPPQDVTLLAISRAQRALNTLYTDPSAGRDPEVLESMQSSISIAIDDTTHITNTADKITALLVIMEAQIVVNRNNREEKHEAAQKTLISAIKELQNLDITDKYNTAVITAVAEASVILVKALPVPDLQVNDSS
ncbi:hypothetical protein HY570_02415 [Candidatus Micrarchaeota archaeon]|nr:hypothetical protein [Candidatus Micrarchaeota archaeon]